MNWIQEPMLLACGAYIVGTATPGPSTLLIATNSMRFGRKIGLASALGAWSGALGLGLLIACGIAAVFTTLEAWAQPIRIAGGLYLACLAIQSMRSAFSDSPNTDIDTIKTSKTFNQGIVVSVFNPNAILSWLATVAIATSSQAATENSAFIAVAICCCLAIVIYGGYALVFAHPRAMVLYKKYRSPTDVLVALLFGAAGLILIL